MRDADWYLDDSRQVGIDFADPGEVATYDARQQSTHGGAVDLVDISTEMLAATQRRATALGASNVAIQRAGFLSFELPECSADFVTTQYALHHLSDFWKLVALQRIFATLKPGGTFLLRDVVFSCRPSEVEKTVEEGLIERVGMRIRDRRYSRGVYATYLCERPPQDDA